MHKITLITMVITKYWSFLGDTQHHFLLTTMRNFMNSSDYNPSFFSCYPFTYNMRHVVPYYIILVAFLLSFQPFKARAQAFDEKIYRTVKGGVALTFVIEDTAVRAVSNELFAFYNFETDEIILRLDLTSLSTGIDTLDDDIQQIIDCDWVYIGKLGVPYLKLQDYSPQSFITEGTLSSFFMEEYPMLGIGTLYPIYNDFISFNLSITFSINLVTIGVFNELFKNSSEEIQVDIWQAILEPDPYRQ